MKANGFDPFLAEPHPTGSRSWLWATAAQALCTCILLGIDLYGAGKPWEHHARLIVLIGITATWSLALRTIRQRLVELMRYWRAASQGLLRKASESGRHWVAIPLHQAREKYIKGAIWRLRIIAAGITIPFFVMPIVWTFVSVALSLTVGPLAKEYWAGVALFMLVSALIVAGYFHWVILPLPAPIRVSGAHRRGFRHPPKQR